MNFTYRVTAQIDGQSISSTFSWYGAASTYAENLLSEGAKSVTIERVW